MRRICGVGGVAVLLSVACAEPVVPVTPWRASDAPLLAVTPSATVTRVPGIALPLPASSPFSIAFSVNDRDEIAGMHVLNYNAGTYLGDVRLTLWSGGTGVDLGNIGEDVRLSRPEGINNRSEIIGFKSFSAAPGVPESFHWSAGTGLRALPLPASASGGFANDINDQGRIVGGATVGGFFRTIAEWPSASQSAVITPPPFGWTNARASAMNEVGDVVGWTSTGVVFGFSSFRAFGGSYSAIGIPTGFAGAIATSVNDLGVVSLDAYGSPTFGGFLWSAGTFTQLSAPILPGSRVTAARFINNVGDVLVAVDSAFGSAALLRADGSVVLLDPLTGALSAVAIEMNTLGTVVGRSAYANGDLEATKWVVPVNANANLTGLSNGVAALAASGRLSASAATRLQQLFALAQSKLPGGSTLHGDREAPGVASARITLRLAIDLLLRLEREGSPRTITRPIISAIEVIARSLRS